MSQNQKGAARGSSSQDIVDVKGDPSKPNSHINLDSNEQKLAAYMGFNYISYLRILLASWPVLKAVFLFEPIGKNMNKKGAFVLLPDEENTYKGVNPKTAWPLLKDDSKDQIRNKKVGIWHVFSCSLKTTWICWREVYKISTEHNKVLFVHELWSGWNASFQRWILIQESCRGRRLSKYKLARSIQSNFIV